MKTRLTALALAGAMLLALAACGSQGTVQPTPSPELFDQPTEEVTATPQATDVVETESPEVSAEPSGQPDASQTPATDEPTQWPVVSEPTAPPSEEPSEEPRNAKTAAELREFFMLTSSRSDAPTSGFSDMSGYLGNFYNLDPADLEDFVFYMPDMSTALQEFFLAKAKPGKVDTVKAACQSRLEGLKEEAEFYPGTADFVDTAKVEVVGDWVVLAVCPEAGRMGKILQDVTQ